MRNPEQMARDAADRNLRMMAEQGFYCFEEDEARLLEFHRGRFGADPNRADFQAAAQNFTVSTTNSGRWEITKAPTIPQPLQGEAAVKWIDDLKSAIDKSDPAQPVEPVNDVAGDSEMLDHILTITLAHSDALSALQAKMNGLPTFENVRAIAQELAEIKRRVPAYKTREQLEEARAMREYGLAVITRVCVASVLALAMIVAAGVFG